MNYGRIRRGPMAADAFTQIRNTLFRDKRLSFKDKGVFGLISTHRDGYGVSAEAIAACSTDGVSAVKVALRNLERHGYLQRTQERDENGRLGAAVYFITDQPEAFEETGELENSRSEPLDDFPPAVEPPAENHPHKKNNSKHTSRKNTLSSRLPKQRAADSAAQQERETPAAPINNQAQQVTAAWQAARGGRRNPAAERDITNSAAELLAADWPLADVIALAQDMAAKYPTGRDLTRHADHWQPPQPVGKPQLRLMPDWCGTCNDGDDTAVTQPARRWLIQPDGTSVRCHCHPGSTARHAA